MAVVTAVAVGQHVRPQVKTGLWEQTVTVTRQGALPMPDSVLSKLTPEQRARVEAQMRANQQPRTNTSQACLTEKDLDSLKIFENSDPNCKQTVRTSTGTQIDAQWECRIEEGITGKGTMHIDIQSPESARGTVHIVADGNGQNMVTGSKMTSRWIGSDCSKKHQ
jgi:hypothetical protein